MDVNEEVRYIRTVVEAIGEFGCGQDNRRRIAYSPAEQQVRRYVAGEMEALGLTVTIDPFGNVIGRAAGQDSAQPAIIVGSHLDNVLGGGTYTSGLGIALALAAIKRLQAGTAAMPHPVEIVAFSGTESSRFFLSAVGSKGFLGVLSEGDLHYYRDRDGTTIAEALQQAGYQGAPSQSSKDEAIKAFVEIGLEQGQQLACRVSTLGIAGSLGGCARLRIRLTGATAPVARFLAERRDALAGAAEIVLGIRDLGDEYYEQGISVAVVRLDTPFGGFGAIAAQAEFWVEARGPEAEVLVEVLQEVKDLVSTIAEEQDLIADIDVLRVEMPVALDQGLIALAAAVCSENNVTGVPVNCYVDHDITSFARKGIPAALLLVPPEEGLPYQPEENVCDAALIETLDVLTGFLKRLGNR